MQKGKLGVRAGWASTVQNVCQAAVGDLTTGDPTGPSRAAARLRRDLPVPENPAESLLLRQSVLLFVRNASAVADRRFHEVFRTRSCNAHPPTASEQIWLDPRQDVARLLAGWAAAYDEWFRASHTIPAALRARLWLEANPTSRASARDVARTAGASRASIQTKFHVIYGLSLAEQARILRLIEGLRLLRPPDSEH